MFTALVLFLVSICVFVDITVIAYILNLWPFTIPYISTSFEGYPMLFFLFILAQILLVILWVYAIYARPIHSLNQDIALFLTGVQSESNLKGNTLNKEMNFVIDFFVKSLEILKNFKDEIRSGRVLKGEVEIASELQRHILQKDTMIIPSLEIAMGAKAATEV